MRAERFRFRPPPVALPPELAWVLARAFAPPAASVPPPAPEAALALADRLGLLPRLAARADLGALAAELGATAGERLRRERAAAAARELRFDETLATVAAAAAELGAAVAPLKGRALVLAGDATAGTRPSADLDLLVSAAALADLHGALRRRGFAAAAGGGYAHHLAPLRHPLGDAVELHRHLPGVRLHGSGFATWEELAAAQLLVAPADDRLAGAVLLPARPVRIAHSLVHGLAQHGLTARFAGWLLVGDLIDLAAAPAADGAEAPRWRAWIDDEVGAEEVDAALALARAAARGEIDFAASGDPLPARLARHFTACALDADYAAALKARWLEAPLDERPRAVARLATLLRAFVPPRRAAPAGAAETSFRRAGRWLVRPFELVRRAAASALAARRLAGERRSSPQ
ncbi:MAG TPA: nucleotidyltransferase family protein [Thermoanaerobaculia bacterium]